MFKTWINTKHILLCIFFKDRKTVWKTPNQVANRNYCLGIIQQWGYIIQERFALFTIHICYYFFTIRMHPTEGRADPVCKVFA